tara:strand:+ start:330 stop:797 length:468 start_codon:yes stop_codon:yes gene_type:complete
MVTPFRYYNLSSNSATMASTTNGTQILPGSNNVSTAGRAIDTYDRNFEGIEGNGTDEGVDYEHHHLEQTGQLTESGYHQDGFVVDDQEEPYHEDSQPLETLETLETLTESRTRTLVCCSCQFEDSQHDEAMDSEDDDSDYEDHSSSEDDDTEDDE